MQIAPSAAASKVDFSVSVPAAAGSVQDSWLSTPGPTPTLVFKLSGPAGRVLVYRQDSPQTQADLVSLVTNNPQPAGSPVSLSMVPIVGNPNEARAIVGPQVSSLDWLEGHVLVTLIAETSNYSLDALRAEAARLLGSAQRPLESE